MWSGTSRDLVHPLHHVTVITGRHGGCGRIEVFERSVEWNRSESLLQQQRNHRGAAEE